MSPLKLPPVAKEGFTLEPASGRDAVVKFSGNGDQDAVVPLEAFLKELHAELLRIQATSVAFDFGELYFMNSSCLKTFVSWIHKVNTTGRPYAITFLANSRLHWQHRSLSTLQRLAPQVVSIRQR